MSALTCGTSSLEAGVLGLPTGCCTVTFDSAHGFVNDGRLVGVGRGKQSAQPSLPVAHGERRGLVASSPNKRRSPNQRMVSTNTWRSSSGLSAPLRSESQAASTASTSMLGSMPSSAERSSEREISPSPSRSSARNTVSTSTSRSCSAELGAPGPRMMYQCWNSCLDTVTESRSPAPSPSGAGSSPAWRMRSASLTSSSSMASIAARRAAASPASESPRPSTPSEVSSRASASLSRASFPGGRKESNMRAASSIASATPSSPRAARAASSRLARSAGVIADASTILLLFARQASTLTAAPASCACCCTVACRTTSDRTISSTDTTMDMLATTEGSSATNPAGGTSRPSRAARPIQGPRIATSADARAPRSTLTYTALTRQRKVRRNPNALGEALPNHRVRAWLPPSVPRVSPQHQP
mmetsp:Transcript_26223/g.98720  ORF Transcript_26223/g.98720 Transcript_26223/m.98720 type:complete len:416 (+) Transcript_26223:104-1351(+)